jgi:hypothetical protein
MTAIIDSKNVYDCFLEAVEDISMPLSSIEDPSPKSPLVDRNESQKDLISMFFKTCGKMAFNESCESLTSITSSNSMDNLQSHQSDADVIQLKSFVKAFESLSLPYSDSSSVLYQLNEEQSTYHSAVYLQKQNIFLVPLVNFFILWETFLQNLNQPEG